MQRIFPGVKGLPALGVVRRRNAGRAQHEIPFSPPATSLRSWTAAGLKVLHDHKIAPQFLFFMQLRVLFLFLFVEDDGLENREFRIRHLPCVLCQSRLA